MKDWGVEEENWESVQRGNWESRVSRRKEQTKD